jgi:phytoene dehydrogenase-like protein
VTGRLGHRAGGEVDAVVVGSGPNGLAAAMVLAGAGLGVEVYEAAPVVGGGARTVASTLPGFRHDVCSAAHPMALASPFFRAFDLAAHGVEMLRPEVSYAHPLDGGRAGLAWRDLDRTVAELGPDGPGWWALLRPLVAAWPGVAGAAMSDLRHLPPDLPAAIRLATRLLERASPLRRLRFRTDIAPALLAGVNAHAMVPPRRPVAAAVGLVLAALGHAVGWPVPRGGSQAIADALAAELRRRGARIVTGRRIEDLAELPRARAVLLDVTPTGLLRIAGRALPDPYARRLRAFRYGPGACKVDFALSGPVPWQAPGCALAGTLHLVGSEAETEAVEREVAAGRLPARPYVLAVQPHVVDATRAPAGRCTLYTYAHVPHGSPADAGPAVVAQIERFAPGFRDLVLDHHVVPAARLDHDNPNHVGGDIAGGAVSLRRMVFRPVPRRDPYATPIPGVYLCSASTPPGPGVHGMCGVHAAGRVLRDRFGIRADPLELVSRPAGPDRAR